jgi:hypothetical protein
VRDRIGRVGLDAGFEFSQVLSDGGLLIPGAEMAKRDDFEGEPTPGLMGAKDEEDRRTCEDSQLSPDRQQAQMATQERSGARVGTSPGNIAVQVDRQAIAQGSAGAEHAFDRQTRRHVATQKHLGLRVGAADIESPIELA